MDGGLALLAIHDGRGLLDGALESAEQHLEGGWDELVIVDDSAHELGFAGAIAEGWRRVLETGCERVFHLEEDFLVRSHVSLARLRRVLATWPVVQVSLKRQPVNEREIAAGGIVEADPGDFKEVYDEAGSWTTHHRYWTTNPSMYRAAVCHLGWPQVPQSEGVFTHRLLAMPGLCMFAIMGAPLDPPVVEHRGARTGHGY